MKTHHKFGTCEFLSSRLPRAAISLEAGLHGCQNAPLVLLNNEKGSHFVDIRPGTAFSPWRPRSPCRRHPSVARWRAAQVCGWAAADALVTYGIRPPSAFCSTLSAIWTHPWKSFRVWVLEVMRRKCSAPTAAFLATYPGNPLPSPPLDSLGVQG